MNMPSTEDRLKAALRARADLVTSDHLAPPVLPVPHKQHRPRLLAVALPLTAAAGIAALIVTATLVRPPVQNIVSPASDRNASSPAASPSGEPAQASRKPGESVTVPEGGRDHAAAVEQVDIDLDAYPELGRGDRNQAVKVLQQLLNDRGYRAGPADGDLGTMTMDAMHRFQVQRRLPVGDRFTAEHWTALLSTGARPQLSKGSSGDAVRRLQRALTAALGRTVPIDGVFGSRTETALRDYQQAERLPVSGIVDQDTWRCLAGKAAPTAPPSPTATPSGTPSPTTTPTGTPSGTPSP